MFSYDSFESTNPICEGSTLMPSSNANYFPKDLPPNTITLGTRVSTQGFLRRYIYAVHNKLSEA